MIPLLRVASSTNKTQDHLPSSGHHCIQTFSSSTLGRRCRDRVGHDICTHGTIFFSESPCISFSFQSTGFNFGSLIAGRLVLGIFEAGFGPAIPLYFCASSLLDPIIPF